MMEKELQNIVLKNTVPDYLFRAIEENSIYYSEIQLCAVAYRYSQTYDQALNLLSLIKVNTSDGKLAEYIDGIICGMKNESLLFHSEDSDCIYELNIVLDRFSATEKYICRDYGTVLEMIPEWYRQYGEEPCKTTEYTVEKRRILKAGVPFQEDVIAGCRLNSELEVCRYYSKTGIYGANDCDGVCPDCEESCCVQNTEVAFPDVFEKGELVYYREPFGPNGYGVVIPEYSDTETCYIVPLEGRNVCYDASKFDFDHIHIAKPYVRSADIQEISKGKGGLAKLYRELSEYLETN